MGVTVSPDWNTIRNKPTVVNSFNGSTGAVTGVASFNGSTGAVTGVASFNGSTGAITGVNSVNGNTGAVTAAQVIAANGSIVGGEVGSTAFLYSVSAVSSFGTTAAGSTLFPTGSVKKVTGSGAVWMFDTAIGTARTGTWRCLGNQTEVLDGNANTVTATSTLWVRIA